MLDIIETVRLSFSIPQQVFGVTLRINYISKMKPRTAAFNFDVPQDFCN